MIDNLSFKIANWIKNTNPEETNSIEVMRYMLNIILNTLLIILFSLIIGVAFNNLQATIVVMISFSILRSFSGGIHIKKSEICIIISVMMILSLSYASLFISKNQSIVLTIVALIIVLIFSPAGIKNQTRISEKYYPLLKIISGVIVASNFVIVSPELTLAFLTQSITLIIYKLKGGENT